MRGQYRPAGDANPFEAYLLGVAVLSGVGVGLGVARPTSVREALPPLLLALWALLLGGGGLLALAGLFYPYDPFTGVEIKRVGLTAVGFACLVYGGAAILLGASGLLVTLYNVGMAAACATRIRQVSVRLSQARAHLHEPRGESGG